MIPNFRFQIPKLGIRNLKFKKTTESTKLKNFTERNVLYQELGIRNQELKNLPYPLLNLPFPLYPLPSTLEYKPQFLRFVVVVSVHEEVDVDHGAVGVAC